MLKNDVWIKKMVEQGMIDPFVPEMVRFAEYDPDPFGINIPSAETPTRKVISYGTGSYGYDLRLAPHDFQVFRHVPGQVVNVKRFDSRSLEPAELMEDEDGQYFIIPANSYALGVAVERLHVPDNITVICLGKSTYARAGIIANVTPAEAGWQGWLTLEFSNASSGDCRIYANEGVLQLLFLEGESCQTTYEDRAGKYQGQGRNITLPIA